GDVIIVPREVHRGALRAKGPRLRRVRVDANDVERLFPLAVRTGRLVAELLELRRKIEPGELATARGRAATFERIVAQETDGRLERVARDLRGGSLRDRNRKGCLAGAECKRTREGKRDGQGEGAGVF